MDVGFRPTSGRHIFSDRIVSGPLGRIIFNIGWVMFLFYNRSLTCWSRI